MYMHHFHAGIGAHISYDMIKISIDIRELTQRAAL